MVGREANGMPLRAAFFPPDPIRDISDYVKACSIRLVAPGRPASAWDTRPRQRDGAMWGRQSGAAPPAGRATRCNSTRPDAPRRRTMSKRSPRTVKPFKVSDFQVAGSSGA